ncbi:hypothetical protein CQW23_00101 [Capsicum baccatum]|uniref:Uncharacterized protein n=1 Tax=Capsicum baccatum TaxID=33114 RepID=A0A2G2XJR4_CAPBA|nr:hypothetical protein CQW23_00101 [Capsicum baccatum]
MNDLYPTKPKTPRVDPTTSATRKSEPLDTRFDKARVDPTESTMRKSEHLDTLVTSIDKATVYTTESSATQNPATLAVAVTSLLDSKKRKINRTRSKKKVEPQDGSSTTDAEKTFATSSKRKKKSWTSLKKITESQSSKSRKFSNIYVPFVL